MHLEKIILTNFKNYEAQTLYFSPSLNGFAGLNGMGKTNLLDAVYYLCMCKSAMQNADADVVRRGEDFFRLEGVFEKENKKEKIVAIFASLQGKRKKLFERNDVPYVALAQHIGCLPVVFFAPGDTAIATGGSEERRRLIDVALAQLDPTYLACLSAYNKILDQRNAYLKKIEDGARSRFNDVNVAETYLLDAYDQAIVKPGTVIFNKRREFVELCCEVFNPVYKIVSGAVESVDFTYESALSRQSFQEILAQNRAKDVFLHRTTEGVHRDDLIFSLNGAPLKKFGSQGQLKSFVVCLKLAICEIFRRKTGRPPILLIDDLFDKLDEQRVERLLELLSSAHYGQIFITDTHPQRLEKMARAMKVPYKIFLVDQGKVT